MGRTRFPGRGAVLALALAACNGDTPAKPDADDTSAPVGDPPVADFSGEEVVFVGEEVSFDAGSSEAFLLEWDFGDGSATNTGWTPTHVYTEPGRYTVRLTATSADGRTDIATGTRVAVNEPVGFRTQTGTLTYDAGSLYAVLPDEDTVVMLSASDGTIQHRLAVCSHPVAVSAIASQLAVACRDDAVQVWDIGGEGVTPELRLEVPLRWGARPTGVAMSVEGALHVALGGTGEVAEVLFGDEGGHVSRTDAVTDARGLVNDSGRVLAARFRSPDEGGVVYVAGGDGITFLLPPDAGPDSDTDARGLPTHLGALAARPDGRSLIVAGSKQNMDRGLLRDGLAMTFETASRSVLRAIDPLSGEAQGRAIFDNRDMVGAVAFTPLGDKLLAAHYGSGMVDILDPFTLTRIGGWQDVGLGLDGIAFSADRTIAWVLASLDKELVGYDLTAGNAEVELYRIALSDVPTDLGARVFHDAGDRRMSQDGYLSCASCHFEGATDRRTWDFSDRGEGLRDTQALFALPDAGPFHWSANFDEVQDFENAIRAHQAGTGFLADEALTDPLGAPKAGLSAELDALATYVRSFTPPRSPYRAEDGAWTEAAERGRAVFLAEGCDTCHAGAEMTDAGWNDDATPIVHDVGTLLDTSGGRAGGALLGLRTPSLHGLWATPPYLHDGRAATLEEALDAHGVSTDADLVRYLLEIEDAP